VSGGHFDYNQYLIGAIAEQIEQIVANWHVPRAPEDSYDPRSDSEIYPMPETLAEFRHAIDLLYQAEIYAQRIDWLLSGDDGEETFHKQLKEDLEKLNNKRTD
jgi:hypothetical protein